MKIARQIAPTRMGVDGVDDAAAVRVGIGGIDRVDGFDTGEVQGHEPDVEPLGSEHEHPQGRGRGAGLDAGGEAEVAGDHA